MIEWGLKNFNALFEHSNRNQTRKQTYFDDLYAEMGRLINDSLIEHNIVHLWPTKLCSYDIEVPGEIKG